MSAPEQSAPPVYACAAGTVLHAHAGSTLEPAVLLWTFLPVGAGDRLASPDAIVDVHSDGPGATTVTVRVLADGLSLSWQLPLAALVAALPGQPGDDGRMVLLGVVDAEPPSGFWASPVDCERLAAELQLPVSDLVDALRGKLTPWLADDLEVLLHDDAHEHAADISPAQTLASAVLAHYRSDLTAEQATGRLVRALDYAPEAYQVELGSRLALALVHAVQVAGTAGVEQVREQTGPFESEVLRLLEALPAELLPPQPGRDDAAVVTGLLLEGREQDETFRAAVSLVARLARVALGPDLEPGDLLAALAMVDDAGLARLARLWVLLALAAAEPGDDDGAVAALATGVAVEGRPAEQWLARTGALLVALTREASGRAGTRTAAPVAVLQEWPAAPGADPAPALHACLALARWVRGRTGAGPGSWIATPVLAAAQAVGSALVDAPRSEPLLDLLAELLEPDVSAPEVVDALVCATAQLLVHVDPDESPEQRRLQVAELLAAVPGGPRGARWLLTALLREAPVHDGGALDLGPFLSAEPAVDIDRAASRAGRTPLLGAGLRCLDALAEVLGPSAEMPREELLTSVLPQAMAEHELLRLPDAGSAAV